MLTPVQLEILTNLRDALRSAPKKSGRRGELRLNAAKLLGCSPATVARMVKLVGFESGRKPRATRGTSKVELKTLETIAAYRRAATNDKGEVPPLRHAIDVLTAQEAIAVDAHRTTIEKQLNRHQLGAKQLSTPSQAKRLTSLHPNHVWQVDSTIGSLYYVPAVGYQFLDQAEFNKNKLTNVAKLVKELLTRWCVVDHATGSMKLLYLAGGESAENLLRFLVWAMEKQPECPMHGVPFILMADQGPANKSSAATAFCDGLDIKFLRHRPRNARATGAVEKSHHLAQMHLEPRYRFMEASEITLDALNEHAMQWAAAYCTTEIHTRHGRTRYAAWMEITKAQLRVPATPDLLREAAVGKVEQAKVDGALRITFRARSYYLEHVEGVEVGDKVEVRPNYFRFPTVDVRRIRHDAEAAHWQSVAPEELDQWGFDRRHVIGEGYESLPDTQRDRNRKALLREAHREGEGALPSVAEAERQRRAHAPAFRGRIDSMADIKAVEIPSYLPRQGTPFESALDTRRVEPVKLNRFAVSKRLLYDLGQDAYQRIGAYQFVTEVVAELGTDEGLPEPLLAAVIARARARLADPALSLQMRAAGGQP